MKKYLIIFVITLASLFISSYLSGNVFMANSPKVNPFYFRNLGLQLNRTRSDIASLFDFSKKPGDEFANISNPKKVPTALFTPLTKGVSAYENKNGDLSVKIDNDVKNVTVREMDLNGQKINLIDLTGEQ